MKRIPTVLQITLAGIALAAAAAIVSCGGSSGGGGSNGAMMIPAPYHATPLVSDGALTAAHVDANLKNPWGVAFNPNGFVWVADNGSQLATLYDGNGVPQSLVVTIPAGSQGDADPTGIVFNGSQDFMVSANGKSGAAAFIFAGEGGTITAWAPAVNPTVALTVFDSGANGGTAAVYKGLALASSNGANFLYATDFHNNRIDVFDKNFQRMNTAGSFVDPVMPAGFAPFGIAAVNGQLFVSFAQQDTAKHDDVAGAGLGFVDVFTTAGAFVQRLVSNGQLNAPWGMALAPATFGAFSNDLLIGNFGDGTLNAFDMSTGTFAGTLTRSDGTAITEPGLWGIAFGNGLNNQPANTLFFAAGINHEADGLYGRIDVGP